MISEKTNLIRYNQHIITNTKYNFTHIKYVGMMAINYLLLDSVEASSVSISNNDIRLVNEYVISSKYSESFKVSKESFTGNTLPLVTLSLLQTPNILHK